MGILGALSSEPIQRLNGYKNVLATIVNSVAALVFILVARDQIDWLVVLLIAIGSTIGGVLGATVGRRLSPTVLRGVIVVIGLVAVVKLARVPLMDWAARPRARARGARGRGRPVDDRLRPGRRRRTLRRPRSPPT